jgi:hypothetical protein
MLAIIQTKTFCLPVSYKKIKIDIYKTAILPVVLYGCETWSLILKEEHRLWVFDNRVLTSWRKLHNDELRRLYSSPKIVRVIKSRRMRWAGHVARMGEGRGVYRILVGRPEGKRPSEFGIDGANWIRLSQDRFRWRALVNTVMNLRVP